MVRYDRAGHINRPLIADADTGLGGLLNLRRATRGYEAADVQGIQVEDQPWPKKCDNTPGRQVIPMATWCRRLKSPAKYGVATDTLIIARTDARVSFGLDEATKRGKTYAKAGADIVFIESPESAKEFRRIGAEVNAWLLANTVPTGMSPKAPASKLRDRGFNICYLFGARHDRCGRQSSCRLPVPAGAAQHHCARRVRQTRWIRQML